MKEMPHDLLAEQSLLGCLLLDGKAFDQISDLALEAADFYHPQYGTIFEAMKDLALQNSPIDYVTVCARLNDLGKLEGAGGQKAIVELGEHELSAANVFHYAKIVKDKSSVRHVVKIASEVMERGLNFDGKIDDFMAEVEGSFFKLTTSAKFGGLEHISAGLKANLKDIETTDRKPGEISGLPTGFVDLDKLILGMQPGNLVVIAARPGMGKTSLGLNIAVNACESSGLPVVIFSLEMLAQELSYRLLCAKARIDSRDLRTKNFKDINLREVGDAVQQLSRLPIYINESGSTTVLDIQGQARKIKAEQGLGLVVVDYLQLMASDVNSFSPEQDISEKSKGLKAMAKELECPVIALSQLNRAVEGRTDKRPGMSDLRGSGSIEQDADLILMIYRDEVYNPNSREPGIAEVIVAKNRSGAVGTAKLKWTGAFTKFDNLAMGDYGPED